MEKGRGMVVGSVVLLVSLSFLRPEKTRLRLRVAEMTLTRLARAPNSALSAFSANIDQHIGTRPRMIGGRGLSRIPGYYLRIPQISGCAKKPEDRGNTLTHLTIRP